MSAGSFCPLSRSREPNVAHAIVENQIIGDEWRLHRRAVDLPVRSRDFEGLISVWAWSKCAQSAIIAIDFSEQ